MKVSLIALAFGFFLVVGLPLTATAGPTPGGPDTDGDTVEEAGGRMMVWIRDAGYVEQGVLAELFRESRRGVIMLTEGVALPGELGWLPAIPITEDWRARLLEELKRAGLVTVRMPAEARR